MRCDLVCCIDPEIELDFMSLNQSQFYCHYHSLNELKYILQENLGFLALFIYLFIFYVQYISFEIVKRN